MNWVRVCAVRRLAQDLTDPYWRAVAWELVELAWAEGATHFPGPAPRQRLGG